MKSLVTILTEEEAVAGYSFFPFEFWIRTGICDPPPYRYEDEINKRTATENDFVTVKKVIFLKCGSLSQEI